MNVFEFMSDSPILTFFIILIVAECIHQCVRDWKKNDRNNG